MIPKANRLKNVKEYYFSVKLREVAALRNAGKPIINLAIGSPDLNPPTRVIEANKKCDGTANGASVSELPGDS